MQIASQEVILSARKEDDMKKILIVSYFCVLTFSLFACSKAALEKEPIVIEDSSEDGNPLSNTELEQDNLINENGHNMDEGSEANPEEITPDQVSNDKDQSESESKDTIETYKGIVMLEGMEEEVNYRTYHSDYGYRMAYDMDRFTVTSEDGTDTYMAENINPEIYPYVFMRITRSHYINGEKPDLIGKLYVDDNYINQTFTTNSPEDNIKIGDYDAVHFSYIDGDKWNSLVKNVYIIALEKYYYVIETNYFLEASEGYGVRINAMLDTIMIEE